jgi:hypothetical protein
MPPAVQAERKVGRLLALFAGGLFFSLLALQAWAS